MPSADDRNEMAGSGAATSMNDDANANLQPIRFGSADAEQQVRDLLSKGETMRVRLSPADEQDVEGHLWAPGDNTLVLARFRIEGDDDDDVEGHAISIHFPDAERARHFRNELLAAGLLTATLAVGVGSGIALAPTHQGTITGSTTQATVFVDTSSQRVREGGLLTQGTSVSIPQGAQAESAQQQIADEISAAQIRGATLSEGTRQGIPVGTTPESAAQQIADEIAAARSGGGADAATSARESGAIEQGSLSIPVGSASEAAQQRVSAEIAAARTAAGEGAATQAREGGAAAINQTAAGDAARTAAGITGSLAGTTGSDASTKAREGGALSESQTLTGPALKAQTGSQSKGGALSESNAVNPAAAADAARTAAGIHGSLAGTPDANASPTSRAGDNIAERSGQGSAAEEDQTPNSGFQP